MPAALSLGLKALAHLALIAVMLSTVCLLRAAILFTIVAMLIAVLPLAVWIGRLRAEEAERVYFS
jgi:hypothetical protein